MNEWQTDLHPLLVSSQPAEHTLLYSICSEYKSRCHPGLGIVSFAFSAGIGRDVIQENGKKTNGANLCSR